MRHLLALAAVLIFAGVCLAAEFKSDEAKKAQADYAAAFEAAKNTYGQVLAKAKAVIETKVAAATDAISKEAIQSESAAITEELVRLRDANAAAFEPREWKSAETKKAAAAYAGEQKAAQLKYGQDLTKARQALLARKAAATDSAAKEAQQKEADLIAEELKQLRGEPQGAKPKPDSIDLMAQAKTMLEAEGIVKFTDEGVVLMPNVDARGAVIGKEETSSLWTRQQVPVPFKAQITAKTDSTNIRIRYNKGRIIFNWEENQDQLRFHSFVNDKTNAFRKQGKVTPNQWATIELVVTDTGAEVLVDGKSRGKIEENLKGMKSRLGIQNALGSTVTVKSFRLLPVK
jgi:hypothetical protein